MYIFLAIATLIFGSAHYYVFARLIDYFELSPKTGSILLTIALILSIIIVTTLPIMRRSSHKVASRLAWIVFPWMGILMLLVLSFLACDIIFMAMSLIGLSSQINLPSKNLFGDVAIGLAISLTFISIWKARGPVAIKNVSITLKRLPKELEGLRIVQISDLHIGPTINGKWLNNIVRKVNILEPDIIAITGDLVDGSVDELQHHVIHLQELRAKYGVYFVTGNHEYYSGVHNWVIYLRSLGIHVLRNERKTIMHESGHEIDIAGVDDYHGGQDIPKALFGRDINRPVVLLAHQPVAVEEAAKYLVDLQLSGHTHGGQIWPWNYLVYLQQPYVRGLHLHKNTDTQIYISSGTGYWGPPMRLGTKAEITDITLISSVLV
jgi:predicted MPP superfamily phosphohydrolase